MAAFTETLKLYYRAWKYRYRADRSEIDWMMQQLRPGDTAFDIGAHKGAYSFWMHRAVGSEGRVVAFEPQPAGTVLLRSLFGTDMQVEQMGLSNKPGQFIFYVQPQAGSVSYEASLVNKYADAQEQVVETTTLDQYCGSRNLKPRLLKIDVEGHELEVLQGGLSILRTLRPCLLIEIEERHIGAERMAAIFTLLGEIGYRGFFFEGRHKRPLADFRASVHQATEKLGGTQAQYINNFVFEPSV